MRFDTVFLSFHSAQETAQPARGVTVSQQPLIGAKSRRGRAVLCSGAYQSVRTSVPEGNPTIKLLIKGGSALNKTWAGTVFHT